MNNREPMTLEQIMRGYVQFEDESTKQLIWKAIQILQELAIRTYLDNDSFFDVETANEEVSETRKPRERWKKEDGSKPEHAGKRWTDEKRQQAVLLRELGLMHKTIADLIGKSPRAVEAELARLRKKAEKDST